MALTPPLVIDVTRGFTVESSHLVHAVIMDGAGKIKAAYGDPKRLTYPRSSLKPLQALALMETGAAADFNLSNAEIALSCASHSGEEKHTSAVSAWLARIGLDVTALECGPHSPYIAPCLPAAVVCNNCSGKHSGMLTLSLFLKAPVAGYTGFDHPVQAKILSTMTEMCGAELTPAICGVDGCSAPNPAMPLENIALGFARFMRPDKFGIARGAACHHLFQAMTEHPDLVAGTGRIDTLLMDAAKGKIMSKAGGEAVQIAVIPEKDAVIALKVEDGAGRAAQAALVALLEIHELADTAVIDAVRPTAFPVLKNWRGLETGRIAVRLRA